MIWPDVETITTARCRLEPLLPAHSAAMVDVIGDPELYEFIGGAPPTLAQLQRRYEAQSVGQSGDRQQWRCNWMVTVLDDARPVGYVQATVERSSGVLEAAVPWIIRRQDQGSGLATEAAAAMIEWLCGRGVVRYAAYIHPAHAASARVAAKLGMHRTATTCDGELRWESNR